MVKLELNPIGKFLGLLEFETLYTDCDIFEIFFPNQTYFQMVSLAMAFPLCKAKKFKTCGFAKKLKEFIENGLNFLANPQVLNFFALHNGKAIARDTFENRSEVI